MISSAHRLLAACLAIRSSLDAPLITSPENYTIYTEKYKPVYIDSSPPPLVFTPTRDGNRLTLFLGPGGCRMFAEERREEHAILKEFLDVKPPPDTTF